MTNKLQDYKWMINGINLIFPEYNNVNISFRSAFSGRMPEKNQFIDMKFK